MVTFILSICLRSFKHKFRKVNVLNFSQLAWSSVMSKLCGIQSNALDKGITDAFVKRFYQTSGIQYHIQDMINGVAFSVSINKTWLKLIRQRWDLVMQEPFTIFGKTLQNTSRPVLSYFCSSYCSKYWLY